MLVTLDTSHFAMVPLNNNAEVNMPPILVTLETVRVRVRVPGRVGMSLRDVPRVEGLVELRGTAEHG